MLVSLLPVLLFSITTTLQIQESVNNAYKDGVRKTVTSASDLTEHLISEAFSKCKEFTRTKSCIEYLKKSTDSNYLTTRLNQLCKAAGASGYYSLYIIPANKTIQTIGQYPIPLDYDSKRNSNWGILGNLMRNKNAPFVITGKPHEKKQNVSFAVGISVFEKNKLIGWIVADVNRVAFSDFLNDQLSTSGSVDDFYISDDTGCIIFSLSDEEREDYFLDEIHFDTEKDIYFSHITTKGIRITGTYPKSAIRNFAQKISSLTFILAIISLTIALISAFLISRSISSPVSEMMIVMKEVEKGNFSARCTLPKDFFKKNAEKDDLYFLMNRLNSMIERTRILMNETILKQKHLHAAEIQTLQSQINPHFLYNTLNSIRSIAKLQGSNDAANMVTLLSKILHEGMNCNNDKVTLRQALSHAINYFEIESYRWPHRFSLKQRIDENLLDTAILPRIVLQPIVENALLHGLEKKVGRGTLEINAYLKKKILIIQIYDDGPGMSEKNLSSIQKGLDENTKNIESVLIPEPKQKEVKETSSGIAMINTHRRLRLMYGALSGLQIFSFPGEGTCVEIHIPQEESQC